MIVGVSAHWVLVGVGVAQPSVLFLLRVLGCQLTARKLNCSVNLDKILAPILLEGFR